MDRVVNREDSGGERGVKGGEIQSVIKSRWLVTIFAGVERFVTLRSEALSLPAGNNVVTSREGLLRHQGRISSGLEWKPMDRGGGCK